MVEEKEGAQGILGKTGIWVLEKKMENKVHKRRSFHKYCQ